MGVELGSEFGKDGGGLANWNWKLAGYDLYNTTQDVIVITYVQVIPLSIAPIFVFLATAILLTVSLLSRRSERAMHDPMKPQRL